MTCYLRPDLKTVTDWFDYWLDISNPRIIGIAILSTSEMSESSSEEVVECEANAND